MKQIYKIVITGGPCAGKTTALENIKKYFSEKGFGVLFLHETATELISGGIAPWTLETNYEFQRAILNLQNEKEDIILTSAKTLKGYDKILLVLDRGTMDNKAYLSNYDFYRLLDEYEISEQDLLDRYDAVFHLVTAAKGAEKFYTFSNNSARTESVESAIELDDKTIYAWENHPHHKILDNSTPFDEKIKRLINEIEEYINNKINYEIEKKFLIEMPNFEIILEKYNAKKLELSQSYIYETSTEELRVRKIKNGDNITYYKTLKRIKENCPIMREEIEEEITKDIYDDLLKSAEKPLKHLDKTRHTFIYKGQPFEIDTYPFWTDKAILEIELLNINEKIEFPSEIKIIKDVTRDKAYRNSKLAKKAPQ